MISSSENPFDGIGVRNLMKVELGSGFQVPETLYHYTTGEGLKGIVENGGIRLTDVAYLNDWTEGSYGIELLARLLAEFMADKPPSAQQYAEAVMREVRSTVGFLRSAVFCLSNGGDILNQWRDYGKDIVPYALGFSSDGLLKDDAFSIPTRMVKIIYDELAQTSLFRSAIEETYARATSLGEVTDDRRISQLVKWAASELGILTYGLKHPSFASENEWRLIVFTPVATEAGLELEFRVSPVGLVPFHTLKATSGKLPIVSATVGPTVHWSAARQALERFMRVNGYHVDVTASTAPLRRN